MNLHIYSVDAKSTELGDCHFLASPIVNPINFL